MSDPVNSKSRLKRIAAMKSETYRCEQCGGQYRDEQLLTHRCETKPATPKRHRHGKNVRRFWDGVLGYVEWCTECGAIYCRTLAFGESKWHYPKEER